MKTYIIYDGRAGFDVDSASVLYVMGAMPEANAISQFKDGYNGTDAVLFSYDNDEGTLSNGVQVNS